MTSTLAIAPSLAPVQTLSLHQCYQPDLPPLRKAAFTGRVLHSCIPPKSNRKAKIRWNRRLYRERNRIERMIGHLKINVSARRVGRLKRQRV